MLWYNKRVSYNELIRHYDSHEDCIHLYAMECRLLYPHLECFEEEAQWFGLFYIMLFVVFIVSSGVGIIYILGGATILNELKLLGFL